MKRWWKTKGRGLIVFGVVTALVAGGLGWVTPTALRMEEERLQARADGEMHGRLRVALWRLDGRLGPLLAREGSRPYHHYSAVFAPTLALRPDGTACEPGSVLEPSPLLAAELPAWLVLHFQTDSQAGVTSPQVLTASLAGRLCNDAVQVPLTNVTSDRQHLLAAVAGRLTAERLLPLLPPPGPQPYLPDTTLLLAANRDGPVPPAPGGPEVPAQQAPNPGVYQNLQEFQKRANTRYQLAEDNRAPVPQGDLSTLWANTCRNGEDWFSRDRLRPPRGEPAGVRLGPLTTLWLSDAGQPALLVVARRVQLGTRQLGQGFLIDWPVLEASLLDEVADLLPAARLVPVHAALPPNPDRTMTALPLELDPGPLAVAVAEPGWTPLRLSLALAWAAAAVALLAVGLGGWSLLDLAERRIRFVSAVTHELRTPLTTLRLYLDMLTGGLVRDDDQRTEYLQTLHAETDRLHRLVGNVLDFSRLENQRPRLERETVQLPTLLEQVRGDWAERCRTFGKELVLEDAVGPETLLQTDPGLLRQVLGNLIDNACKYSRDAADPRIWLRAGIDGSRLVLEVEDRGPGVARSERRSIFRPFQRGGSADLTAGGVGLGLALVQRWVGLLGGRLSLCPARPHGACFRVELPR
jgi:signal transduction histidine kinase